MCIGEHTLPARTRMNLRVSRGSPPPPEEPLAITPYWSAMFRSLAGGGLSRSGGGGSLAAQRSAGGLAGDTKKTLRSLESGTHLQAAGEHAAFIYT